MKSEMSLFAANEIHLQQLIVMSVILDPVWNCLKLAILRKMENLTEQKKSFWEIIRKIDRIRFKQCYQTLLRFSPKKNQTLLRSYGQTGQIKNQWL